MITATRNSGRTGGGTFTMVGASQEEKEKEEKATDHEGECLSVSVSDDGCFSVSTSSTDCFRLLNDNDDEEDKDKEYAASISLGKHNIDKVIALHSIGFDLFILFVRRNENSGNDELWLGKYLHDQLISGGISDQLNMLWEFNQTEESGLDPLNFHEDSTQMYMYKNEGFSSDIVVRAGFVSYVFDFTGTLMYDYQGRISFLNRNLMMEIEDPASVYNETTTCQSGGDDYFAKTYDTLTFDPQPEVDRNYPDRYYFDTTEGQRGQYDYQFRRTLVQAWEEEGIYLYMNHQLDSWARALCLVYADGNVGCGKVEFMVNYDDPGIPGNDYSVDTPIMYSTASEAIGLHIGDRTTDFRGDVVLFEGDYMYFYDANNAEWIRLETVKPTGKGRTNTVLVTAGVYEVTNTIWDYDKDKPNISGGLGGTVANGNMLIPQNDAVKGATIEQSHFSVL